MIPIAGKTVYILGAGASHHTGAPLLRDFLVTARHLLESNQSLTYKKEFTSLFEWIDSLRSSAYYVELNMDNLEHIFSLAEMTKQIGLPEGQSQYENLQKIISETLDRCYLEYRDGRLLPDNTYKTFSNNLREMNEARMSQVKGVYGSFEKDVIITFNYDVMLDYVMLFSDINFDYCLNDSPQPDYFRLLKLHGSTSWAYCHHCASSNKSNLKIQMINPSPIRPNYQFRHLDNGTKVPFKMVTDIMTNTPCSQCQNKNLLPLTIPPTWSKKVENLPIHKVWNQAVKEIKDAVQIIVIGYSLPTTDTFFQYLLTVGLAKNQHLHRVVVVDLDDSDSFKLRYKNVFSRGLDDRGKLKFYLGKTFTDYVNHSMKTIGRDMKWG